MRDILKGLAIVFGTMAICFFIVISPALAEVTDKPVICSTEADAMRTVGIMNQQIIYKGIQAAPVRDPSKQSGMGERPLLLPTVIFMNLDTGTWSILEYHESHDEYCLIAFGNGGHFTDGS